MSFGTRRKRQRVLNKGETEQFNGREGETATLFGRCPSNSELRGFGFAPRHLSRYAAYLVCVKSIKLNLVIICIVSLLNVVPIMAQNEYSILACASSSTPRDYVGNKFILFLPNNKDEFILSFPKKSKFKRVQDIDYTQYFVGYGKKKNRVWVSGIFGPHASEGIIPKDWLSTSVELSQRKWTAGAFEGVDVKGKLANGNYWRYFGSVGQEITYHDVSPEAADYFDKIVNSVCYLKRL